jgi:ribosomal protein L37AE/L43A
MFIENKYTTCYHNIINRAIIRPVTGYTESHHIIPKSLGGSNELDNLVNLTAHEHFVCHLLLTKMVSGSKKFKMIKAAMMMAHIKGPGQERYKVTGRIYNLLKSSQPPVPIETRNKQSIAQKTYFQTHPGTFTDKTHTEETKRKMRKPKPAGFGETVSKNRKGKYLGKIPHNKGKTFEELYGEEKAKELKKKIANPGEKNGFYGKQHSAEQRQRKREEKLKADKQECPYCKKLIDPMNYGRWHGENCKQKTK